MRHIYLDYNSIALRLDALAGEIQRDGHDALVAILRGGSFSGMHLAFLTDLQIYFLQYDRSSQQAHWVGPSPDIKKVLLCEDFAGSGNTLIHSKQFLIDEGYKVSTCVVCVDRLSASVPDYACFWLQNEEARIILPWERYRVNYSVDTNPGMSDLYYEKVACDMDGVLLDDVDSKQYVADLNNALKIRDERTPASYMPDTIAIDCIISGRPTQDEKRTLQWLDKYQINIPVYLRDDKIESPTAQTTAKWKAKKALELGCTHFIESDAEQAATIASICPEIRVIWWNFGQPLIIQASNTVLYRSEH